MVRNSERPINRTNNNEVHKKWWKEGKLKKEDHSRKLNINVDDSAQQKSKERNINEPRGNENGNSRIIIC